MKQSIAILQRRGSQFRDYPILRYRRAKHMLVCRGRYCEFCISIERAADERKLVAKHPRSAYAQRNLKQLVADWPGEVKS